MNGYKLFTAGETAYMLHHDADAALQYYQKAIKKIIKDEVVTAQMPIPPGSLPPNFPTETLAMVFQNLCGFFRDPAMNYTEKTAPEAYKLLFSFRPNSTRDYSRFRTPRAQLLKKAMQANAGMTLGLLAWDAKDRATAAKRYQEVLDIGAGEPAFNGQQGRPAPGLETWGAEAVQQARDNLAVIVRNDETNAQVLKMMGVPGGSARREVHPVPNVRVEAREGNAPKQEESIMFATDQCGQCEARGAKLLRCSRCTKIRYCNADCQKAHWPEHKKSCVKVKAAV